MFSMQIDDHIHFIRRDDDDPKPGPTPPPTP